mmetsp:Transcript_89887/g.250012  ORF Transcript_89887/g.250012 Transcript_89887/m.250012 type:complete len:202 (+) Transcript_89887:2082-2687(+)
MVSRADSTWALPLSTLPTLSPIRLLISLAASALRPASDRTSPATTAKPRPCSPARAASTAAFSARMLVWKAMPSITPMMSAMRRLACWMPAKVLTMPRMASPVRWTTSMASLAWRWALWTLLAVLCTVLLSSSIDAAVCCRLDAWASVRALRSWLPWAIWPLAVDTQSTPWRTACTRWFSVWRMACIDAITLPSTTACWRA